MREKRELKIVNGRAREVNISKKEESELASGPFLTEGRRQSRNGGTKREPISDTALAILLLVTIATVVSSILFLGIYGR